jgi:hypothetical protein
MKGKTNATTSGRRSAGIPDEERTMDSTFITKYMLEETLDSSEVNLQSKTSTKGKYASQFKIYWCPTSTMLRRSKTLLHVWGQ